MPQSQQTAAMSHASPTFCPFKAPQCFSLPFSGQLASFRRFEQRPGMALVHVAFPSVPATRWPGDTHLQIAFLSAGSLSINALDGARETETVVHAGNWLIAKPGNQGLSVKIDAPASLVWIECDLAAAQSLTGFSDTVSPKLLEPSETFATTAPATGRLLALAHELAGLTGETTRERLLIESKTLEWLALILDQPIFSPCAAVIPARDKREQSALAAAARILETRCHEDHSIAQLSREIHLNEFKLKRGFKESFGTTVFGFLRQKRMELARELLRSEPLSIIEVANRVGYSNPSHFARAFKEEFGLTPSAYLKADPSLSPS